MGNLPLSRTETCINGAPVDPNLLNEIQDVLIAKLGGRTLHFNAAPGIPQTSASTWQADAGGVTGTPLPQWTVAIQGLLAGETISAVRARIKDAAATTLTFITTKSVDTVETGIGGAGTASAASGAWQTLSRTLGEVVVAGTNYYATIFTSAGAGIGHFAWIEVDVLP